MYRIFKTKKFSQWFLRLEFSQKALIESRLVRIEEFGYFGDAKNLGGSLSELRWKNGTRLYFSIINIRAQGIFMKKFDPKLMKTFKLKKGIKLDLHDPKEFFRSKSNVATALAECLMNGDIESFHEIMQAYLSIINKEELSRKSKLPIATIRRVAAGANYNIETLMKITAAINKAA